MTEQDKGQIVRVGHCDDVGQNVHVIKQFVVGWIVRSSNSNLLVRQLLRDISCVNPSRTPKAFKGKGSALSQGVTSGLRAVSTACVGVGA
jgi:hypothetical protein